MDSGSRRERVAGDAAAGGWIRRAARRLAGPRAVVFVAAVGVAVAAATLVGLADGGPRAKAATGGVSGASGLIARLAVLQRAQTPADELPTNLNYGGVRPSGLVPSLTRLLGQLGGVSVYLVVTAPPQNGTPLWSPSLGDEASLLVVDGGRGQVGFAFPAAEFDDASLVTSLALVSNDQSLGIAQLVPDGVTRVRLRDVAASGATVATASAAVQNNLALLSSVLPPTIPRRELFGVRARLTWYRADGSVVPTSDRGLRRARAAQQLAQRRRLLREVARSRARAPASLLGAFAVFAVHGGRGVTRDGTTVSAPPPRAVPTWLLGFYERPAPFGVTPDLHELRRVRTPGGHIVWVIPGQRGLCIAASTPSGPPGARGAGGFSSGGSCSRDIATAEQSGVGFAVGGRIQVGVLPAAHPTVRLSIRGRVRTLRPPFGVYYYNHARRVR